MKFDITKRLDVEHNISPPLRRAITVPLTAHAGARGMDVILYIGVGSFAPIRGVETSDKELTAIAAEVVARLQDKDEAQ